MHRSHIAKVVQQPEEIDKLSFVSFNCKDVTTSVLAVNKLLENAHFLLLQETWLFECNTYKLSEIGQNLCFAAKGVDLYNPISPVQVPRGYGGVAILWKKDMDHLVTKLDEGNQRIQCVEIATEDNRFLVVSVYMPSRNTHQSEIEFQECTDQLREIIVKYSVSHEIIIGGDMNTDLSTQAPMLGRTAYLNELILDFGLHYDISGKTFTNSQNVECTEIDYFLIKTHEKDKYTKKVVLNNIDVNISDHHPVQISVATQLRRKRQIKDLTINILKTNWNKVDTDLYSETLRRRILSLAPTELDTVEQIENFSLKIMSIIKQSMEDQARKVKPMNSKPKLKVWTEKIGSELKNMRAAFKLWSSQGKPREVDNIYF